MPLKIRLNTARLSRRYVRVSHFGAGFFKEFDGIGYLDGVVSECPQKKLRIIEIIKILERIGRTELNAFDFLQIDVENFLLHRCCSAEFKTAERFFKASPKLPLKRDGAELLSTLKYPGSAV